MTEALEQGHPEHMMKFVPEELAHALYKVESLSPHELGMERTAKLRRWISLANSFGLEEASLKTSTGERRGKRGASPVRENAKLAATISVMAKQNGTDTAEHADETPLT